MASEPQVYTVHPIGFVRASEQEGRFEIEVSADYVDALEQLDRFSHVVVIWWADGHDRPEDRKILTTELPYARGERAGVFACRSEYRPNPIGITTAPILGIDRQAGVIRLAWIDAFDGTPVLDLKPYLPVSDRVRDCSVAEWMQDWPTWMEDAGEFFASNAVDFGG
jgi:tRNA-Thr(GGU) m(6)t(6)A37 methyltransferase TsaA